MYKEQKKGSGRKEYGIQMGGGQGPDQVRTVRKELSAMFILYLILTKSVISTGGLQKFSNLPKV